VKRYYLKNNYANTYDAEVFTEGTTGECDFLEKEVTLGKSLADFKLVIPLTWIIGGAKVLPSVIEL